VEDDFCSRAFVVHQKSTPVLAAERMNFTDDSLPVAPGNSATACWGTCQFIEACHGSFGKLTADASLYSTARAPSTTHRLHPKILES
tara:strand:- start:828 stop:1088 length:261 start_codon:yes stop_codon:yes gene_type:complete